MIGSLNIIVVGLKNSVVTMLTLYSQIVEKVV
jgi:hypothetical protein